MAETPQHPSWSPPNLNEPDDKPLPQRGYGLFEAPSAPEEFPAFTPYRAPSADDFPPDSAPTYTADSPSAPEQPASRFQGFPSDEQQYAPPAATEQPYVPAPAVLPIPGVTHDNFTAPTPPPAPPQPPQQAPEPEAPESLSSGSDTWSAFAAGDGQRPQPPAWERPSFESPPSSFEYQSASYEGPSSFPSYEPSPEPFSAPSSEPAPPQPQANPMADPVWPPPPPPSPLPEEPVAMTPQPGAGSARVAGAAQVPNRVTPSEPLPTTTRSTGRVYGSSSVSAPPPEPVAPISPVADMPVQPPAPAPLPPADVSNQYRASARPPNVAQPDPSDSVPRERTSRIYTSPTSAAAAMAAAQAAPAPAPPVEPPQAVAPLPPRQRPSYEDLLAQPTAQGGYSPSPPMQREPHPAPPVGVGWGEDRREVAMPQHTEPVSLPSPPPMVSPQRPMSPPPPPPVPGPNDTQQSRFDAFVSQPSPASTTTSTTTQAPPELKGSGVGRLFITVVAGCVALLVVSFGGLYLIDKLVSGPTFKVGDCVKQSGVDAVLADCAEPGAFRVTSVVANDTECDQSLPYVQQNSDILCLQPVSGATPPQDQPTTAPSSSE